MQVELTEAKDKCEDLQKQLTTAELAASVSK